MNEKKIDITKHLISISINGKTIKVKTNKPLINSELININNQIKTTIIDKFKKLGINFNDFKIKYY